MHIAAAIRVVTQRFLPCGGEGCVTSHNGLAREGDHHTIDGQNHKLCFAKNPLLLPRGFIVHFVQN